MFTNSFFAKFYFANSFFPGGDASGGGGTQPHIMGMITNMGTMMRKC